MRGLQNLALAQVQAKRYEEALATCDRLVAECDDAMTAAAHRASAYLDIGRWQEALDAARHIHQISPGESLLAAFAAFELRREGEARAYFLHAVLNKPRTVGGVLGVRFVRPRDRDEAVDHNDGVLLARTLDDFLRRRRPASRRLFGALWEHPMVKGLFEEVALVTARWQVDRKGQDRSAFDRMQELHSWEFASRAWGADGPRPMIPPLRTRGRGLRQLHGSPSVPALRALPHLVEKFLARVRLPRSWPATRGGAGPRRARLQRRAKCPSRGPGSPSLPHLILRERATEFLDGRGELDDLAVRERATVVINRPSIQRNFEMWQCRRIAVLHEQAGAERGVRLERPQQLGEDAWVPSIEPGEDVRDRGAVIVGGGLGMRRKHRLERGAPELLQCEDDGAVEEIHGIAARQDLEKRVHRLARLDPAQELRCVDRPPTRTGHRPAHRSSAR